MIRAARTGDAAPIAAIFNEFLDQGGLSDTDKSASVEGRREWLSGRGASHPVFVCEEGGGAVGWVSLSPFAPRPECEWLAEVGVYLATGFRGRGLGAELLRRGMDAAREGGLAVVYAVIFARNEPSLGLFAASGFESVARLDGVAHLRGRAEDVLWLAKDLR